MVKHVLVPLDGTKNAEAALETLSQMCQPGDRLVFLTVERPEHATQVGARPGRLVRGGVTGAGGGVAGVATPDVPVYLDTPEQAAQRQRDEATDYLEGLAQPLRDLGLDVETVVLINEKPEAAIIEYAEKMKPSFVAMLRRTQSGLGEILFGRTASAIARSDVAPILFVPGPRAA